MIDEVKMPNFMFYRGRKYKNTTFFFFSRTAMRSLNKMDIIATKFSAVRLISFHETFLIFSEAKSNVKFLKVQSALPRSGSLL